MARAVLGRALLAGFLAAAAACSGSPAPSAPSPPPIPVTAPPSPFPPAAGPARVFAFDHQLEYPVHPWTRDSRFTLYDTGAFVLECGSYGPYRGAYTEANGVVTFTWEGSSIAGPWGATATISGDSFIVRYNDIMLLSDFEDAVYTRTQ